MLFHGERRLRVATNIRLNLQVVNFASNTALPERVTRFIKRVSEKCTRIGLEAEIYDRKITAFCRENRIQRAKQTLFKIGELK